jgi:hypothetical protein
MHKTFIYCKILRFRVYKLLVTGDPYMNQVMEQSMQKAPVRLAIAVADVPSTYASGIYCVC